MKTPLIEKLTDMRRKSGLSYDKLGEKTGISASTINRWYNGQGVPSLDEIELLCDAMGFDIKDIFVTVGKQELTATQAIGYQGAEVMVEHYEARLTAEREKREILQSHHEQRINEINESHAKSVAYLMEEIKRLRGERDSSREASLNLAGKKHTVFWVLVGIDVVMAILLFIALFTGPIV